ncbi:hypothetical protein LF887_00315 [Chryseobacterium sp. MEBOG06]|nr:MULTISPECIES: hypothetical protein [unclassified Chryseobacterium]UKB84127.1 hypothetical protein LF887_00315 [Chryseobacterium sp. MEBOG06]
MENLHGNGRWSDCMVAGYSSVGGIALNVVGSFFTGGAAAIFVGASLGCL